MRTIFLLIFFLLFQGELNMYAQVLPSHPRILMSGGEEIEIKEALSMDTLWTGLHRNFLKECNNLLNRPLLERKKVGMRLLATSREALRRILFLSYAYRITGDEIYFQRAEEELLTVCRFSDWNPSHFLDVAEMVLGVAIGFDWLYTKLSADSRRIISEAIMTKGLLPAQDERYNWYLKANHNWNQVCNAGIAIAALAVYEQNPEMCRSLIRQAVESVKLPMAEYAPDGAYPEGYSYWRYGTTFNVLLLETLEKVGNWDLLPAWSSGFMNTPHYYEQMVGPTGYSFNYADCGDEHGLAPVMFWFAKKTGDLSLLWTEKSFMQKEKCSGYLANRLFPLIFLWGRNIEIDKIVPPEKMMWIGGGITPVALMRTSWTDKNALYVGIKGGTSSSNHSHMDAGSFVMDAMGIRWAMDLGKQDYESLESKKMQIWSNDQHSERWKVFRYNNYAHNTLTINNKLHDVKGYACWKSFIDSESLKSATIDLTTIFKDELLFCQREIAMVNGTYVVVRDSVKTDATKQALLRWTMLTRTQVREIQKDGFILEQDGKRMNVKIKSRNQVQIKRWSAQSGNSYDAPNPNVVLIGFEAIIPAGEEAVFETVLCPEQLVY